MHSGNTDAKFDPPPLPDDVAKALYFLANTGIYTPDHTWQQDPRAADAAAVILSLSQREATE